MHILMLLQQYSVVNSETHNLLTTNSKLKIKEGFESVI